MTSDPTPSHPTSKGSPPGDPTLSDPKLIAQIQRRYGIVGRERELTVALAALAGDRHLLLEGPVGTGRSTLALAVCRYLGHEPVRVAAVGRCDAAANGRPARPADHGDIVKAAPTGDDAAAVTAFNAGPLAQAMRDGRPLLISDLDHLPEAVQNALAVALDERLVCVPEVGEVRAAEGFAVVATIDSGDRSAGRVSGALGERFEHLALGYQSAADEAAIVAADSGSDDVSLVGTAVRVTRGTRLHPGFARGASVRGASDMVTITEDLWAENRDACGAVNRETLRRAAETALIPLVTLAGDADDNGAAALDDLLELVCGRGQDPDVVLAASAARGPGRAVAP